MNILIGKYGKSCLFNEKSWGMIAGEGAFLDAAIIILNFGISEL